MALLKCAVSVLLFFFIVEAATYFELGLRNSDGFAIQDHIYSSTSPLSGDRSVETTSMSRNPAPRNSSRIGHAFDSAESEITVDGLSVPPHGAMPNGSEVTSEIDVDDPVVNVSELVKNSQSTPPLQTAHGSSQEIPPKASEESKLPPAPVFSDLPNAGKIKNGDVSERASAFAFLSGSQQFEMWRFNGSHRSGRDPSIAPLACRVHSVCLLDNGTTVLPDHMHGLERYLDGCGFKHFQFASHEMKEAYSLSTHTADQDLLLAEGLDGPSLLSGIQFGKVLYHQFLSRNARNMSNFVYKCLAKDSFCDPGVPEREMDKEMTLFSDQIASLGDWSSLVLNMLNKSEEGKLSLFSKQQLFHDHTLKQLNKEQPRGSCFRSIIVSGEKGHRLPSGILDSEHHFYKENKIVRDAGQETDDEDGDGDRTQISISFIHKSENGSTLGIPAAQVETIQNMLRLRMPASKGIQLLFKSVDAGNMSMEDMRETYASSNVIVSTHGIENLNMYFMRSRSMLVEVFPYSMQEGPFDEVSHQLGIQHVGIIAMPDKPRFMGCMARKYSTDTPEFDSLEKTWDWNAEKFGQGSKGHSLHLERRRNKWIKLYPEIGQCAYEQRTVLVDVEKSVRAIFDKALVNYL